MTPPCSGYRHAAAQQVATQASAALNNLNVNTQVSNATQTNFTQR